MGLDHTWNDIDFVVAGSGFGSEAAGLLGQNVFRVADVEYDLANGVIRLVKPKGDCKHTALAYWSASVQKPYPTTPMPSLPVPACAPAATHRRPR